MAQIFAVWIILIELELHSSFFYVCCIFYFVQRNLCIGTPDRWASSCLYWSFSFLLTSFPKISRDILTVFILKLKWEVWFPLIHYLSPRRHYYSALFPWYWFPYRWTLPFTCLSSTNQLARAGCGISLLTFYVVDKLKMNSSILFRWIVTFF